MKRQQPEILRARLAHAATSQIRTEVISGPEAAVHLATLDGVEGLIVEEPGCVSFVPIANVIELRLAGVPAEVSRAEPVSGAGQARR
jgi:hypothetical protein